MKILAFYYILWKSEATTVFRGLRIQDYLRLHFLQIAEDYTFSVQGVGINLSLGVNK